MSLPKLSRRLLLACFFLCWISPSVRAHPIPDIPVCGSFEKGGGASFSVEVNPRCFDPDPTTAASLTRIMLANLTPERREELLRRASELVKKEVEFFLEPSGAVQPAFLFEFTGEGRKALETDEDVVVITGIWKTQIAAPVSGWSIRSAPENKLSVVFQSVVKGVPHPRVAVLFPGERSYTLDLTPITGANPFRGSVPAEGGSGHFLSTLWSFCKQGFGHVIPDGLDHILFVLGVFLLTRSVRPLLWQVSMFTLAHSLTLALVTLGRFDAPARVVQPLIAATIALVAVENIWKPSYSKRRLLVVFAFGLVHGLGFASALSELAIPRGSLLGALGGFNLGVELGQLAVIAFAWLLTGWLRHEQAYRRYVAIPGSALIGVTGLYWMVERLLQ